MSTASRQEHPRPAPGTDAERAELIREYRQVSRQVDPDEPWDVRTERALRRMHEWDLWADVMRLRQRVRR